MPIYPKYDTNGVDKNGDRFSSLDILNAFVASMIHDFQHPGVTGPFLKKTNHAITTEYDQPYMENFHYHEAMRLIMSDKEDANIFKSLDIKTIQLCMLGMCKNSICKLVLSTALSEHYSFIDSFKQQKQQGISISLESHRQSILELAIKVYFYFSNLQCADVSNPAKEFEVYKNWISRIITEFHTQGNS
eukprot:maker-scaffold_43-snap-gene-1.41-mRNA-1 protein AED:0.27 eAED:0.58 QI:0/0/0/0.8/0.5/0.4/5/0/188